MGGSYYSDSDYKARVTARQTTNTPVFTHQAAVSQGRASGVHPALSPRGVTRESRDSDAHPVALPIAVLMDTSGSMREVPAILEKSLSRLMGIFLDDKSSGKRYLGDAYPAVMVGALDNYSSTGPDNGTLQVGQFESGIEIDNDLERILLTGMGGDPIHESYELALYFMARHTVTDHWEKRGRKGYLFIVGDEISFQQAVADQIRAVIGDEADSDVQLSKIMAEVLERWNTFFVLPKMTHNWDNQSVLGFWRRLLGENVLTLEDPSKLAELIAATVAVSEESVDLDDLATDGLDGAVTSALVAVAAGKSSIAKVSADALPAVAGTAAKVERI